MATYRDFLTKLASLTPEQLDSEIQVLTSEGATAGHLEIKVAGANGDCGWDRDFVKGTIYIDA